jgi:hypothetical protein
MNQKKYLNRIRGWLPKEPSFPNPQKTTLSAFENRLKRLFKIQELSNAVIIVWMLGFFLSFGVFSNFIDGESLTYNLFQGVFISLFTGGVLYGVMILIRRRKRCT